MADKPKRYMLFGGQAYYASGGFHDYLGSFGDLEKAVAYASSIMDDVIDWWHIFDCEERKCVACSEYQAYGAHDEVPRLGELAGGEA